MIKRAAIILSGGKGRRFQDRGKKWKDKALAEFSGKPLLVHAILNVKNVADQVIVSVNDEERKAVYSQVLKDQHLTDIEIVVDQAVSHISGPNVAIMSGLRAIQADYCLVLPSDMPFLQSRVAEYLFEVACGFDVAVPMWPNGRLETLLMVLRRQIGLEITETLCKLKRPRSDDLPRGASKTILVSPVSRIKTLDPDLKSFININSEEDLVRLRTRHALGPVTENLKLDLGTLAIPNLHLLQEGAQMLQKGSFSEAQGVFGQCAKSFEAKNSLFWEALSFENQGEALLKLSGLQTESKPATEFDFAGKEAFLRAANCYRLEEETYDDKNCRLLAERALADKAWCESWAMGKAGHVHRYPSKVG